MRTRATHKKYLSVDEAVAYAAQKHGFNLLRSTIYNGAVGRCIGPKIIRVGSRVYTTPKFIDEFVIPRLPRVVDPVELRRRAR